MHGPLKRTVSQIDDMTTGELELALEEDTDKRRAPEGFRPMSPGEMAEAARLRREGGLAERIRRAKGLQ